MTAEQAIAFFLFAFVAAITPGPSNLILTSTGASVGVLRGLPSLFGVAGGGQNFFERAVEFAGQLVHLNFLVLTIGVVATGMLVLGQRFMPGRPVALAVVALAIVVALVFEFSAAGVPSTGKVPSGLPSLAGIEVSGGHGPKGTRPLAHSSIIASVTK